MEEEMLYLVNDLLTKDYNDKVEIKKDLKDYLKEKEKKNLIAIYASYCFAKGINDEDVKKILKLINNKKEEVIDKIIEYLNNNSIEIFKFFNDEKIKLVKVLADKDDLYEFDIKKYNEVSLDVIFVLEKLGLIFCKRKGDKIIIHMPNFINNLIKKLPESTLEKEYKEILEYTSGIVNTYGALDVEVAYQILKRNFDIEFNKFISIIEFSTAIELIPIGFDFEKNAIYNLTMPEEKVEEFLDKKREIAIYNSQFYKDLGNGTYIDNLKEYRNFVKYLNLIYSFGEDDKEAEEEILKEDIIGNYVEFYQFDKEKAKNILKENINEYFQVDKNEENEFISFVEKIREKFPIWENGGMMENYEVRKVGRNDPCPCGSNKKYKNCCGRNK